MNNFDANNFEVNEKIYQILGIIQGCEEIIEANEKAISLLRKELQEICYHPTESIKETIEQELCGEFHYYETPQYRHTRVCVLCLLKESYSTLSKDKKPDYQKLTVK